MEKSTHETMMGLQDALSNIPALANHPNSRQLIEIVTGETDVSSAGFPYISSRSFRLLAQEVPHLYRDGAAVLQWLAILEGKSAQLTSLSGHVPCLLFAPVLTYILDQLLGAGHTASSRVI